MFDLFNDGRTPRAVGLLAFARYSEAKYDWEQHFEQSSGRVPTTSEVERWIRDQSDRRLQEILDRAVDFFDEAANAYLAEKIEQERQAAVAQSILAEVAHVRIRVERATSFWATIWTNLFMGVISGVIASFAFALIVIAASVIFEKDPSIFAIFKKL